MDPSAVAPNLRFEARALFWGVRASLRGAGAVEEGRRALEQEGLDWNHLVRLALYHGVTPQLHAGLEALASPVVPGEILAALGSHCARNRERNEALATELLELVSDLSDRGIPVVPFGGPLLAELAFGDLSARAAGDLDLLVQPEYLTSVAEALAGRGYLERTRYETGRSRSQEADAWSLRYEAERSFVRPRDAIVVHPHWSLAPWNLAIELDHAGLRQRAVTAGRELPCFALEDLLLVLCVQATWHEWGKLGWIADLAGLVARHAPDAAEAGIDWAAARERARARGCGRILALGLALAERLLGELPEPARALVSGDPRVEPLVALVERQLFDVHYSAPSAFRLSRLRWRSRERLRDRVRYALRTLATPRLEQRRLVRLPRFLAFLYPLLTPLADALLLPLARRRSVLLRGPLGNRRRLEAVRRLARGGGEARDRACAAWLEQVSDAGRWLGGRVAATALRGPRARLLDLGPGVGEASVELARRVHPRGTVVAAAGAAALRAARAGELDPFARLARCGADMEDLPFADGSFDAIACRFGLHFCGDPGRALRECHRVLRPGGEAMFAVWGPIFDNTLFDVVRRVVPGLLEDGWPDPEPLIAPFAARGSLARVLRSAGFERVDEHELVHTRRVAAEKRFWRDHLEDTLGRPLDALPEATRGLLEDALAQAFGEHLRSDGYRLRTHVRIAVAVRTGSTSRRAGAGRIGS